MCLESLKFFRSEGKGRRIEKIFEKIMGKMFPNLMKTINSQTQEAPMNPKY